jgi:hypothetical protein
MSSGSKKMPVDSKAKTLSNLEAQKMQALANNDTKTASLIQKVIDLLTSKKQK